MTERRRHQYEVDRLLEAIRAALDEVELARVRGVRGPALAEQEAGVAALRDELATRVRERWAKGKRGAAPSWQPALR